MKRYTEVSKHVAGRTITQRYPARSVGKIEWPYEHLSDFRCKCGYAVCSQAGPCAPVPVAPEPPAVVRVKARVRSVTRESLGGVLPKGWRMEAGAPGYLHTSGAEVHGDNGYFTWWTAGDAAAGITEVVHKPLPTRDAAMAAALASVQPAQPTLRAGWVIRGTFMGEPDYWFGDFNVCSSAGDGDWLICSECGFELAQRDTLEGAMQRAEALARGEP
jgi:hypothetical protein